ncbi:N-acetylgalactosamine-6-O-sulfatase [subsurface metagenome]
MAKNYAAMITRMDSDVGRMMDLLEKLHLEDNTIVIFTSDNGPYQGVSIPEEYFNNNGHFRGGKRDLYEGGIRIPFIVKWRNTVQAGSRNDRMIAFWDVLPTVADIIGYPGTISTDGLSFLPGLTGKEGREHDYLYWDYGHVRPTFKQAIRLGDYKMLRTITDSGEYIEIYDLAKDAAETRNIADEHPELLQKMKQFMINAYHYSDDYRRKVDK